MIEKLTGLPAGVDGLRARGKVTREDYEQVVQPLLEQAKQAERKIRFLYHLGPDFDGFTAAAAWEDTKVGFRYLRLFERCAVVTDIRWLRDATRAVAMFMPCPVRVFSNAELQNAVAWLGAPTLEPSLSHRFLTGTGVLVVEPQRRLRAEDIEEVSAEIDPWIESNGALRGVVVHAREFPGWENLDGALHHARFVREHRRKVGRVALAADGKLAELAPRIAARLVGTDVRQFPYDRLDEAIAWAES